MTLKEWILETKEVAAQTGTPVKMHQLNAWHVLENIKNSVDYEENWSHLSDEDLADLIDEEWNS